MAYADQKLKERVAPRIKALLAKYNLRGSLSIRDHRTLVLTVSGGKIDFIGNRNQVCSGLPKHAGSNYTPVKDHIDVNGYWYHEQFSGTALECLTALFAVLNDGNWDRSDLRSDYFDVGWYVDVNIGRWNKPYRLAP